MLISNTYISNLKFPYAQFTFTHLHKQASFLKNAPKYSNLFLFTYLSPHILLFYLPFYLMLFLPLHLCCYSYTNLYNLNLSGYIYLYLFSASSNSFISLTIKLSLAVSISTSSLHCPLHIFRPSTHSLSHWLTLCNSNFTLSIFLYTSHQSLQSLL